MKSALFDIFKTLCATMPSMTEEEANDRFKTIRGRDDFGPRLSDWLEKCGSIFPEPVTVTHTEHMQDHGVDVLLEGLHSGASIAFQIKSNHDMKKGFLQSVKAQLMDASAWKNIELYVIILGCECSKENWNFYQRLIVESRLHWNPPVLVLPPRKAASLWDACDSPLTKLQIDDILANRTWPRFFTDVGKPECEPKFLQRWSSLSPEDRFIPPKEFVHLQEALLSQPLTVLIGSPAVGKTFTAVYLLWQHYQKGKPIAWIEPNEAGLPDFPVPSTTSVQGLSQRIENLCTQLGNKPPRKPVDVHEFISTQLEPNSLLLIEDPFGATDEEYARSLHTYDFFDLNTCVAAITEYGARHNCRIILTSRHGLFEQWQSEARSKGLPLPEMKIIRLSPESYESHAENHNERPKVVLATKLLCASGKVFDADDALDMAFSIGENSETPREIEMVIDELPSLVTWDSVRDSMQNYRRGVVKRTEVLCRADTDAERLFLFMLCGLSTFWYKHRDFSEFYDVMHRILKLPNNSTRDEELARKRYWGLYYMLPVTELARKQKEVIVAETKNAEKTENEERKPSTLASIRESLRTVEIPGKSDLRPGHSSVKEAIHKELSQNAKEFINLVAIGLPNLYTTNDEVNSKDELLRDELYIYLLSFSKVISPEAATVLAQMMPVMAGHLNTILESFLPSSILGHWKELPDTLRETFLDLVKKGEHISAAQVCRLLTSQSDFPISEAWQFYDIMLTSSSREVGGIIQNHSWEYFIVHLDDAPVRLTILFDLPSKLEAIFKAVPEEVLLEILSKSLKNIPDSLRPSLDNLNPAKLKSIIKRQRKAAAFILGRLYGRHWNKIPNDWKEIILSDEARSDKAIQEQVFWGLLHPLQSGKCPNELLELLRKQLNHPKWEIRGVAGTFILVYWEVLQEDFHEALKYLLRTEMDFRAIEQILHDGRSDHAYYLELVDIVMKREV